MTHRLDVARGRDIVARWCALAERRLEHLTELFETGRWRRYHSEIAFLENIQEAKSAVEMWRNLLVREASRDNSAIDVSWLCRSRTPLPLVQPLPGQVDRLQSRPAEIADDLSQSDASIIAETARLYSDDAPPAPASESVSELMLNIDAIEQRYPLLRNAL
jgi:hypothetical protein